MYPVTVAMTLRCSSAVEYNHTNSHSATCYPLEASPVACIWLEKLSEDLSSFRKNGFLLVASILFFYNTHPDHCLSVTGHTCEVEDSLHGFYLVSRVFLQHTKVYLQKVRMMLFFSRRQDSNVTRVNGYLRLGRICMRRYNH